MKQLSWPSVLEQRYGNEAVSFYGFQGMQIEAKQRDTATRGTSDRIRESMGEIDETLRRPFLRQAPPMRYLPDVYSRRIS